MRMTFKPVARAGVRCILYLPGSERLKETVAPVHLNSLVLGATLLLSGVM
jgi:hypothetical protein